MRRKLSPLAVTTQLRWKMQRAMWLGATCMSNGRWMVWCAAVLLVACAVFLVSWLIPLHEQVVQLEAKVEQSLSQQPQPITVNQSTYSGNAASTLLESLPEISQRTVILDAMVDAAPKHNLYLQQAQYHWLEKSAGLAEPDKSGSAGTPTPETIQALQWTLPVKGSYRDIREYVGALLESQPSLALDSIALNRDGPMGTRLDADLLFTLYLRGTR